MYRSPLFATLLAPAVQRLATPLLTTLVALTAADAFAATLAGRARDASGGVVPGAAVTVRSLATDASVTTVTQADGLYVIPALAPGRYRVEVRQHVGDLRASSGPTRSAKDWPG